MADAPVPVKIISPTPMPVEVVAGSALLDGPAPSTTTAEQDRGSEAKRALSAVIPPTTTSEQDRMTAGQRHINVMWERTQQIIATSVTLTVLAVCAYLIVYGAPDLKLVAFTFLSNVSLVVIQNYFQRTNHTKVGGVGGGESMGTR